MIGLLQHLEADNYDVLVISPDNYFLFTPLLPSSCVGTCNVRSLVENIRKILVKYGHKNAEFLEAKAINIDYDTIPNSPDIQVARIKVFIYFIM